MQRQQIKLLPFTQWIKEVYNMEVQDFKRKPAEIKISIRNHYSLYLEVWDGENDETVEEK